MRPPDMTRATADGHVRFLLKRKLGWEPSTILTPNAIAFKLDMAL